LIAMLDSNEFTERQQATQDLAELAELAESALRRAQSNARTLEQRRRVENLLELLQTQPPTPEQLRYLRSIEVLEHLGTSSANRLLEMLAKGAPDARVTREAGAALVRLGAHPKTVVPGR
jgi:hypothetical protein